ncbi:MAG TPA: glycosyltransferase family 2 protein [Solirubrobacterales bacterium]|nr:glycosyltransferase family 2 protein [Solirubrobacterales bacterium]
MNATAPTVYIPTLNGGENLRRCLESLQGQTLTPHVVVADNGEGEGSAAMLAESFPTVTRVGFGRNLGFGNALNRAIREAGEGPIVLLNDDAVAEPRLIESLVAARGEAEMVAAVLLSERDPERIDSAGVVVDQTLMAFDYLCGASAEEAESAANPLGPTGGAALYDRDAFNAVGGFDERIFLYYEDVDLALRMRAEGARCVLAPPARAIHGYSLTLGAGSARKYAMTGWSRGYLLRRYGVTSRPSPAAQALARETAICAGQLLRARTLAGARGRIEGWRAGKGLSTRALPAEATTRLSLRRALALRNSGHGA